MNKIIVANQELAIDNEEKILDIQSNYLCLKCQNNNKIIIKNKETLNLDIILEDNSSLDLILYSLKKSNHNKITIVQNNNTTFNYREAFINENNTKITIENILKGNNNKSKITLRTIANQDLIDIEVLAKPLENTKNNEILEDIKGINNGGKINIKPNMEIDSFDIIANHFVTIGSINPENLFYLQAKGISQNEAKELILQGFIKSIFFIDKDILFGGDKK